MVDTAAAAAECRAAVHALRAEVAGELREMSAALLKHSLEARALRACLLRAGHLRQSAFEAALHRAKFNLELSKSFAQPQTHPLEVLQTGLIAVGVMRCSGWSGALRLQATCRPLNAKGREAVKIMRRAVTGNMYVCGGVGDNGGMLDSMERFNFATGLWEESRLALRDSTFGAVAMLHGCLYFCGGLRDGMASASVDRCELGTAAWDPMPCMHHHRDRAAAIALDSRLYVFGGVCYGLETPALEELRSVERYDLLIGDWEDVPPMVHSRSSCVAVAMEGEAYVCGGVYAERALRAVERYEPISSPAGSWSVLPPMLHARACAGAASLNGCLFIVGGCTGGLPATNVPLSAVESFNPATWNWEACPPMIEARQKTTAAVSNGELYVFGGATVADGWGEVALSSVERLNFSLGAWQSLPPMKRAREGAFAVTVTPCIGDMP